MLLFVRLHRREGGRAGGITEPFRCLGLATYEGHEGERPMAIRWRLERAIPAAWLPGCCLVSKGRWRFEGGGSGMERGAAQAALPKTRITSKITSRYEEGMG